jgi:hypothetical protein
MEFSRRAVNVERLLAAAALAAALGAAWAESGSGLAARVRDGRPWPLWIEARERGRATPPTFHFAVYDPVARRLSVVHVPGELKLEARRTLERAYLDALKASADPDAAARAAEDLAEGRLRELSPEPVPPASTRVVVEIAPLAAEDEPALSAALALKERGRRPRAWLALAREAVRGLRRRDPAALDSFFFALELRRAPLENLEPARLPEDAQAPPLLGKILRAEPREADARATTVEVLNGAGASGLATRAKKMLRLKGVDVQTTGGAAPRARTLVYDRTGDFQRARGVVAALGCPTARAFTRVDLARAVDASVELGEDCAGAFGTGESREP